MFSSITDENKHKELFLKEIFKDIRECLSLLKEIINASFQDLLFSECNHALLIQEELLKFIEILFKNINDVPHVDPCPDLILVHKHLPIYSQQAWFVMCLIIEHGYQVLLRGGVVRDNYYIPHPNRHSELEIYNLSKEGD